MMRLGITLCMLWLTCVASQSLDYRVVCYFGSWADYRPGDGAFTIDDIDPTLCTHLIYGFVGITEDAEVSILDPWNDLPDDGGHDGFAKFVALRELSPETKFMIAMGGWNEGSVKYSNVVTDPTLRSNLVDNVVNFTLTYEFDGFDLDWEYPNQRNGTATDVQNYVYLLEELREAFDEYGLILSTAVGAAESTAVISYNVSGISDAVHFINLMTYDFHVSSEATVAHNAPLYPARRETTEEELMLNIDASVNYWLEQGAQRDKIILGIPFYGHSFTLSNATVDKPGSASDGPGDAGPYSQTSGTLFYYEVCELLLNESYTRVWDKEQHVPYAYKDDQWVSYDDERSITEKMCYIKARHLGGAMIWAIDEDDFAGVCGEPNPLLNAINDGLRHRRR